MRQWTTDRLKFGIPYTVSEIRDGYVTFSQGGITVFEKNIFDPDVELSDGLIAIPLTQEQTGALPEGTIEMQIRLALMNGDAPASDKMQTFVDGVLKGGVI